MLFIQIVGHSETPHELNVELSIVAYVYERLIYLPDHVCHARSTLRIGINRRRHRARAG